MSMTTGEVIRRIRKSYGMTQRELGTLMGYAQPVISQLENNAPCIHDVRMLRRVARALHVPIAILVVQSDEEADVDRRNFSRASMPGAGTATASGALAREAGAASIGSIRVGAGEVAEIVASTNQIHELDLVVGGDRLCRVAVNGVRYVTQLLDNGTYTDTVGQALTSAAAEMMTAAGWVHFDAGRTDQARRYYAEAAQTATAADDGIAAAHALINASLQSSGSCFSPCKLSADSRPRAGLNLAAAAYTAVRREGGPRLHHQKAAAYLQAAVAGTKAWPRENVGWRIKVAEHHILGGEIAEGCQLLIDHFDQIGSVPSTRLRSTLDSISADVRHHAGVPEVREYLGMRAARV